MRENDYSPDLNTLHLEDYEKIAEKKAKQVGLIESIGQASVVDSLREHRKIRI